MDKNIAESENAFVDLLNQEMKELQESQKQEEMMKLEIEESTGFYSAFINDMRISRNKPLGASKTFITFSCPKKYILQAIGIPENAVVLTKEEYDDMFTFKTVGQAGKHCGFYNILDTVRKVERKEAVEKFASLLTDGRQTLDICEKDTGKVCDKAYIIPQSFINETAKEITEGKYGTDN